MQVWRARCKSLGNDVAIKIVNLEKAGRSMVRFLPSFLIPTGLPKASSYS